ncbi:MAG: D-aminoacylase [Acidobacteria bacterium]|nr:D-aminoacylase [Acidobacteriota bacterium]
MKTMDRRTFIRGSLRTAGLVSAGGAGLLLRGCTKGNEFDLLIAGGTVYDGTGGPPFRADLGISGGAVRSIGRIRASRAATIIKAEGMAVSPGFIDVHDHTAESLLVNPRAESAVRQGVTTLVSGQCGDSPFPLTEEAFEKTRLALLAEYGLDLTWRDIRGFLGRLDEAGAALNYATFVGHGTVRAAAMGFGNRAPSAVELERMKVLVAEAMTGGALGLSSGLEYTPGSFASTEELIELCRVAAGSGGVYATHMRDEEAGILEAVDEALRIAKETPIRLQISHLKIGFAVNWPKFPALLDRLERARAEGIDFRCDRYPYIAWATGLDMFFPLWSREGTTEDFIVRLRDASLQDRLRAEVAAKEKELGSWEKVLISSVATDKNRPLEGMNILAAATRSGQSPYEFMRALLVEETGRVGMITFAMSEDQLKVLLAHPLVGVGSDGSAVAPYGTLAKGKPHPRFYGTFPRVLGKYVREEKVVSLEEIVRKMTAMPAAHLGFVRRGMLKIGWAADICVFDPERVIDKATFTEPAVYPEGIRQVVVNGEIVVDEGRHTGRLPGKVLRKNARRAVA